MIGGKRFNKGVVMKHHLPEDPIVQRLVAGVRKAQLDRRAFLRGGLTFGGAALGATALTACGGGGSDQGDGSRGSVRWANWTYYLDYNDETGEFDTLSEFMRQSNIQVEYFEDIDDNKMFIGKVKDQLELEQDTGYDVFTLTDSQIVRQFELGQLQAFDRDLTPHVNENMLDFVKPVSFDPNREYSIPYQSGMTGLVYNAKLYPKGIREVSDLWDPELAGKVSLLTEQADTLSLIMLEQGVDITADWGDDEFFAAIEVAEEHINSGQVYTVKGNSYTQDLQQERVLAGMAWSGDIAMINDEAGEEIWKFVVPDSGATMFIDSFCMPNATEAGEQVAEMIDYYYEPEVAAEVAAYVQYVTPVDGAQEAMEDIDPDLIDNPLIFPDDAMQAAIHLPRSLTSEEDNRYSQAFAKILGN